MPVRTSEATWKGKVKDGEGEIALGSGAWRGGYSFRSRFTEEEPTLSNPEELIVAGHAGCFSLSLANILEQEGYDPQQIYTEADCHLEMDDEYGPTITRVVLHTEAVVEGVPDDEFLALAEEAKKGCPVSRALTGEVKVDLEAKREA